MQVLGLSPDSDLVLRTAQGRVTPISPSAWSKDGHKWAPSAWVLATDYTTGGDNPKADYVALLRRLARPRRHPARLRLTTSGAWVCTTSAAPAPSCGTPAAAW